MADAFSACLAVTAKWEGGYADHPADPGGATHRGVTQATFDAWLAAAGRASRPVRTLTDAEWRDIYRRGYWDRVNGEALPAGVDLAIFDFGVNSGPPRAVKYLQRIVGAVPDGVAGPVTLALLAGMSSHEVIRRLCEARLSFVRSLRTWSVFGKGWGARIGDILARALAMAGATSGQLRGEAARREARAARDGKGSVAAGGGGVASGGGAGLDPSADLTWVLVLVCVGLIAAGVFLAWRSRAGRGVATGIRIAIADMRGSLA